MSLAYGNRNKWRKSREYGGELCNIKMNVNKKRALEILERKRDIVQTRLNDKTIYRRKKEQEKMLEEIQALDYAISKIKRSK